MNYCETLKYLNDYVKQEIKEIMKTEIFKVGDRVYHYKYGWGEVIKEVFECDVLVRYETENLIGDNFQSQVVERMLRFDLLSFTEYTLQGFTQERHIVLPEKGELCLVRDNESQDWQVRKFLYYKEICNIFVCLNRDEDTEMKWKQMKRIKILD